MKILQINKFHYLRGGSEKYMFDLSAALKQAGHEVVYFSMADGRNLPSAQSQFFIDPVAFDRFSLKAAFRFVYNRQAVKRLRRLLDAEKPDIAHLHNVAHQLTPAIIKVLKRAGVPVIMTLHDYKLVCPNYRLYTKNAICERCRGGRYYNCIRYSCSKDSRAKSILATIEAYWNNRIKKYYDLVDMFIAPSRYLADVVMRFGIDGRRVRVLHNFSDVPAKKPRGGEYLFYFGRLSEEKGLFVLLEAMKRLPRENLKIAGVGPLYQALATYIDSQQLTGRVELVGPKYGESLERMVSNAKAVIFPSLWPENMPLSLIEAMRAGKVVLASRVGGMPELIESGKSGYLFEPNDADCLANAIKAVNNTSVDLVGSAAQSAVAQLVSSEHVPTVMRLYEEVILANNKHKNG